MAKVEIAYFDMQKRIDASGACLDAEIPYVVSDVANEDEALSAVKATAGSSLSIGGGASAPLARIEIDERVNARTFRVKAVYEKPQTTSSSSSGGSQSGGSSSGGGGSGYSFETGGGTRHLTVSRSSARFPSNAPDYGGAICVDSDGTVHGVDVTMPALTFTINKVYSSFSASDVSRLASHTGKVNSDSFEGFAPGEVLFLGASGGKRSDGKWEISYKFSVSPNESAFSVGSINVGAKKGWDYAWVRYQDEVSGDAVVRKPAAVYVESVYERASFAGLVS